MQIVHSLAARGAPDIEHIGSAHDEQEVEALKAAARQRLAAGQGSSTSAWTPGRVWPGGSAADRGLADGAPVGRAVPGLRPLGFDQAAGGDEVFRQLVLARIIEPTSKQDSLRVLAEAGVDATVVSRRSSVACRSTPPRDMAAAGWPRRARRSAALGPASLVLYDVSTLYFETDAGDGFREPGFSKERRLEPQITIGLLTDATGFPLMVDAFEGNKAETTTMLPTIRAFMAAHRLPDVTVVADAGHDLGGATSGRSRPPGCRSSSARASPTSPTSWRPWRRDHPGRADPRRARVHPAAGPPGRPTSAGTRSSTTSTRPIGPGAPCAGSTSRSPRPRRPSPGRPPVKRNRFIKLFGGTKSVNRALEAKARALAGLKGYVTNLAATRRPGVRDRRLPPAVPDRDSRSGCPSTTCAARPIYHHKRESIEAHLTIVFAALAVSRLDRGHAPAGRSASSSAPPAATAPSTSAPAATPSPPTTRYPTTSATRSRSSADEGTNLARVGTHQSVQVHAAEILQVLGECGGAPRAEGSPDGASNVCCVVMRSSTGGSGFFGALSCATYPTLGDLDAALVECRACPRLVAWREQVRGEKRAAYRDETYWGRPVPGFGPPDAALLIVGLAPAAHGGNRTGRMFTGDRSGDVLYAALHAVGLANQPTPTHRGDGLALRGTRITAPVHCAPPAEPADPGRARRLPPLAGHRAGPARPTLRAAVALGGFGWQALLAGAGRGRLDSAAAAARLRARRACRAGRARGRARCTCSGCYHVSQQNTFTGRLTPAMLAEVLARGAELAGLSAMSSRPSRVRQDHRQQAGSARYAVESWRSWPATSGSSIVGGGYVGMYAALRLQHKLHAGEAEVTVDRPAART